MNVCMNVCMHVCMLYIIYQHVVRRDGMSGSPYHIKMILTIVCMSPHE